MMKKTGLSFCLMLAAMFCMAQADTDFISSLIRNIRDKQVTEHPFFIKGLMPSYIDKYHRGYSERIMDNNPSIIIALDILQNLQRKQLLTNYQTGMVDSILSRSIPALEKFKNKKGRGSYNFWVQDASFVFPYNKWIPFLFGKKNCIIPDDMDDTSISFMVTKADSSSAARMHDTMFHYAEYLPKRVIGSPPAYKKIGAYNTWFGYRFPVFLDICVAANTLRFVEHYQLKWNKADSATLQFIEKAISTKDYFNKPSALSPYYENRSIILYNISNLMAKKKIPELEVHKEVLISDAMQLMDQTNNILEKMILSVSIIRLGGQTPNFPLPAKAALIAQIEKNDLPFFTGNFLNYFEGNARKIFSFLFEKEFHNNHYCPAINLALAIEYFSLTGRTNFD